MVVHVICSFISKGFINISMSPTGFFILENGRKIIQKSYILNFVATVFVFAGIFVQYD